MVLWEGLLRSLLVPLSPADSLGDPPSFMHFCLCNWPRVSLRSLAPGTEGMPMSPRVMNAAAFS